MVMVNVNLYSAIVCNSRQVD